MRRIVAACLLLSLIATLGCGRRVTVQKPTGSIIIDDRVVDILSEKSLTEAIAKAPADQQAALIRDWMASKERIVTQQLNNEDKRQVSFWGTVLKVIEILAPAAVGYLAAK